MTSRSSPPQSPDVPGDDPVRGIAEAAPAEAAPAEGPDTGGPTPPDVGESSDTDEEDTSSQDLEEESSSDLVPAVEPEAPGLPPPSGADYVSDRTFRDFPLSEEVLKALDDLQYRIATPVQAAVIEPALAGRDLVVRAKTGTGKTAAFAIPLIERLAGAERAPRILVLAPTRELALQVAEECAGVARYKDVRVGALYGGVPIGPQVRALEEGVEIVVGTPGRVLDHLRRGTLDLGGVRTAVLDEADEMLSMGFLEDVTAILDRLPKGLQVLLLSATVDPRLAQVVRKYLHDPEHVMLSTDTDKVEGIRHVLYETSPDVHRARSLLAVIEKEDPSSALVFVNTREDATTVATFLHRQGLDAEAISGSLPQPQRERVLGRLKRGELQFLVATDVAARGIDVSGLSHVIQYALPEDPAVYLHRSGRTGRLGRSGVAVALAGGPDLATRTVLERRYGIAFDVRPMPSEEEAATLRLQHQARQLAEAAELTAFEGYLGTVRALRDHPDGDRLLAVALRAFFLWDRTRRARGVEPAAEPAGDPETASDVPPAPDGRGRRRQRHPRRGRRRG